MHAYDIYASSEAKKKEEVAHRFPPRGARRENLGTVHLPSSLAASNKEIRARAHTHTLAEVKPETNKPVKERAA